MSKVKEAYEVIGKAYRRRVWDVVLRAIKCLRSDSIIADLGSGDGHNSIHLLREGYASTAVLLDISESMLSRSVGLARNAGVDALTHQVLGDLTMPPFRSNAFNAVLAVSSIHHLTSRELRLKALKESLRILKEGGTALIVVWARWQAGMVKHLIKGLIKYLMRESETPWDTVRCSRSGVCREYHLYSLKELLKDVELSGFKVAEHGTYVAPGKPGLPRKNYYVVAVRH